MKKRAAVLLVFCLLATAAQGVGLYFLCTGQTAQTANLGENSRHTYFQTVRARRGMIYDFNLKPLVDRESEFLTVIEPQYLHGERENLMELLNVNTEDFSENLKKERPFGIWTREAYQLPGISSFETVKRYGKRPLALHVTGYTDAGQKAGISGLEKAFDGLLSTGCTEGISYIGDARGRSISGLGLTVSIQGDKEELNRGVRTTLDIKVQEAVDKAADQYIDKGAIVVLDVSNGYIKGLSSRPDFDPTRPEDYLDSEEGEFLNRAFLSYPLGSVFKTVVAAAALDQGLDPTATVTDCTGAMEINGNTFHCLRLTGHGELNMSQAFDSSCNLYFMKLAIDLGGVQALLPYARALGFGEETVFYEGLKSAAGNLPGPSAITDSDAANFALGQGDFLATPLQAARMMATVANGGIDREPVLLYSEVDENKRDSKVLAVTKEKRALSPEVAKGLQKMLRDVVVYGTGKNADIPELGGAAGKTGSAEAPGGQVHGWFCGYVPANDPKYAIAVLCEDGRTGGGSAAPAFQQIAREILSAEG